MEEMQRQQQRQVNLSAPYLMHWKILDHFSLMQILLGPGAAMSGPGMGMAPPPLR